ncbi:MAG: response regulator [Cellulosilyticaceae bacterium]
MGILVVDDHPLVRRGIIDVLKMNQEEEGVIEADNVEKALQVLAHQEPEMTLVDLNLGKENGFWLIEKAKERQRKTKFVILTSSSDPKDFKKATELGVEGYILKDAFIEDIVYAIGSIRRGQRFFSEKLVTQAMTSDNESGGLTQLTPREQEIFQEVSEGYSNAEISKRLCIAEGTVKKHVSNILCKLGLGNRVDLMVYAYQSR